MKYKKQINWSFPTDETQWKTSFEHEDINKVIKRFEYDISLARLWVAPQRIIDSNDQIIKEYDNLKQDN